MIWVRKVAVGIFLMPGGIPFLLAVLSSERGRMFEFSPFVIWMLMIVGFVIMFLLADIFSRRSLRKRIGLPDFNVHVEVSGYKSEIWSDHLSATFVENYAARAQSWRPATLCVVAAVTKISGAYGYSKLSMSGRVLWLREGADTVSLSVPVCESEYALVEPNPAQLAAAFAKNAIEAWQAELKTAGPARTLPFSWPAPPSNS